MARVAPDFWLTNATGNPSHASTYYVSFSNAPVPRGWRGSAVIYISTLDQDSSTFYNVSASTLQSFTGWTYPTGLTKKQADFFRVARSNVATTQNFSGTIQLGNFGSSGEHTPSTGYWAKQNLWIGISVPDNAPSGWYYGRVKLSGTYSMPAGAQTLTANQAFKLEVRPLDWQGSKHTTKPIVPTSGPDIWKEGTKHVAFRGNRGFTTYEPYVYKADKTGVSPTQQPAHVISSTRDHQVDQTRGGAKGGQRDDEPFMWVRGEGGMR